MAINTILGQNIYNNPYSESGGVPDKLSSISPDQQLVLDKILYNAIVERMPKMFFTRMASTIGQPKHAGKRIKLSRYFPIIDDRNVSDQGIDATGTVDPSFAKLYGDSRDISTVMAKLPSLTEYGGRVNRLGMTRVNIESEIEHQGAFIEMTRDSLDFDTDPQLFFRYVRELKIAATTVYEDRLCADLISKAGVIRFCGAATKMDEMGPNTDNGKVVCIPTYEDFTELKKTLRRSDLDPTVRMLTGTTAVDTVTVSSGYVMYVHDDMENTLRNVKDSQGEVRFTDVKHYAKGFNPINDDEIGEIGGFHIICTNRMLYDQGKGADIEAGDTTYYHDDTKYNVYPLLVVGNDSFNTIGFINNTMQNKFSFISKPPSPNNASAGHDPFGLNGFMSIQWWYGTLVKRPEWLAVMKSIAVR